MNQESNRTGKTLIAIVITLFVLGVLAGGWYIFQYKPAQEAKQRAQQERIAKEEAEQKRIERAAQLKAQYDQLILDADEAYSQEDWETALVLYTEASSLFPNEQYPRDQITLINAKLDDLAAVQTGTVEQISTYTGRYYIVVSSSIDDDLAMDYADKLAEEGNSVTVIAHDASDHLYYRVTLGNYDTKAQAEAAVPSYSNYGEGVWVLKY